MREEYTSRLLLGQGIERYSELPKTTIHFLFCVPMEGCSGAGGVSRCTASVLMHLSVRVGVWYGEAGSSRNGVTSVPEWANAKALLQRCGRSYIVVARRGVRDQSAR